MKLDIYSVEVLNQPAVKLLYSIIHSLTSEQRVLTYVIPAVVHSNVSF